MRPLETPATGLRPERARINPEWSSMVCVGCVWGARVIWQEVLGGEEKGTLAGGSREAVGHCHEGN